MRIKQLFFLFFFSLLTHQSANAQTASEILDTYTEKT